MMLFHSYSEKLVLKQNGNFGIGTSDPPQKLSVNGAIICTELIVQNTPWADFVFSKDYTLPSLIAVERFIAKNGHLPGIPSEDEINKKGVSVGQISAKLLLKIEELTLYVIKLKKENEDLKSQILDISGKIKG